MTPPAIEKSPTITSAAGTAEQDGEHQPFDQCSRLSPGRRMRNQWWPYAPTSRASFPPLVTWYRTGTRG